MLAGKGWFLYALAAAVLWGFSYALSEKVLRAGVAPSFMLVFSALITLPLYLGLVVYKGQLGTSLDIMLENKKLFLMAFAMAGTVVIANYFILLGIGHKSATIASLIEMSYPLFTAFFTWLIFRDLQITPAVVVGAALMMLGVTIIYVKG